MRLLSLFFTLSLLFLFTGCDQSAKKNEKTTIGVISFTEVDKKTFVGFQERMAELGYPADQVRYVVERAGGQISALDDLVAKVLAEEPDLIFVSSTPGTLAVAKATKESRLPVVFGPVNDPLAAGLVKSLRQPGGHITGIKLAASDARRLDFFVKTFPSLKSLYVPYHSVDKSSVATLAQIRPEAERLGVKILAVDFSGIEDLTTAVAEKLPAAADAIFLPRDSRMESMIDSLVDLAEAHKLPLCAPSRLQMEHGALYSYGFHHHQIGRQAAQQARQILQGADPGTLSVEAAANYSYLNMAAAKKIGLEVSDASLRMINEIFYE